MGFDLSSARPYQPQQRPAAGAAPAGFNPATAQPTGGLPAPMQRNDQIPGVDPQWAAGQAPAQVAERQRLQRQAENPISDRVLGAVEGALDLVAKLGGGTVGGLLGLATAPFTPRSAEESMALGAQAGVEGVRRGYGILGLPAAEGPTTATGQAISGTVDTALEALPPVVGVYGTLAGPTLNAGAAARQVATPVVQGAQRGMEAAGAAVQRAAEAVPGLRRDQPPQPTPGTQGSAGAAGTDMAAQRRARARGLPVPFEGDAALTEGQATRSFEAQRFERETAKDPDIGQPLRERAAEQNQTALRNLDALESFTGAQKTERGAAGQVVVDAIAEKASKAKQEIDAAYSEARDAGDMAEPIDVAPLARWIEENRSSAGNAGVIGTAEAELQRLGGAQKASDGSLVPYELSLNDLEELRKKIVAGGKKDATNAHFAGEINKVIDAATEGKGGELYKAARAKFKTYQAEFKERGAIRDLIGIKKGTSDRITAMEKVLERAMRSTDDLKNVRETLITAGDGGAQAWREVQGQAMRMLRDQVTRGSAPDIRGNPIVSPAKLKQTIDAWDADGRLEVLFGKKGAETLRDLRDVGQDLFTAPPGSVNTSNTASVLAKWMADSAASWAATGVPLPLVGLTRAAWDARRNRKVKKQIQQALGPKEEPRATAGETSNPFAGSDKLPPDTKPPGGGTKGGGSGTPPTAAAAADPRMQEIARLKAAPDVAPETVRVLEAQEKRIAAEIRAGKAAARRETEADALERAAASTFEPAVRQSLLARANELRGQKLPVGQARELSEVPAAKPERTGKIPVGEAKELPPEAAAPAAPAAAPRARATRRERELQRLRDETTDPEVARDLDRAISAERDRATKERRGEEYLRLADSATDPEVRAAMEARAKKLGVTRPAADEKIPAGEATELDVQTVADGAPVPTDAPAPAAPDAMQLPPDEVAAWSRRWGFGQLDAEAATSVRDAMRYDAAAVEQAAQQHAKSPVAFGRAIQRIIDEGKTRESEAQRAPGGGEGSGSQGTGLRGQDEGGGEDGGTPVEPGSGRPRAPDSPGGGAGAARPADGEVDPPAAGASRAPQNRGSEDDARRAGYTLKAYRGVSASNPFNETDSTWLTTNRDVAKAYAEEVMGYDDPAVLEVMVRPDDLPRRDASRLSDEERSALQADEFGNPQAIGIYDRSDDHPFGGGGNVTVIHAPKSAVWLIDKDARPRHQEPTAARDGTREIDPDTEDLLQEFSRPATNKLEAERAFNDGDRLFVVHEQSETAREVVSIDQIEPFTADQILILSRDDSPTPAPRERPKAAAPAPAPQDLPPDAAIVSRIDANASPEEKVRQLQALTEENRPIVERFLTELDRDLGTRSGANVKAPENILAKSRRPSILAAKPWHGVEHIRDSYRFKTVLDSIDTLPQVVERLRGLGAEIIKADVEKVLKPKEFGWRIIAFDLRMANGQLVEYYLPVRELEAAKKKVGHHLFEEVRNLNPANPEHRSKYQAVAARSRAVYEQAWADYLERTGADEMAVRASLDQSLATAGTTASQPSSSSPKVMRGAGDDQLPSGSRFAENSPGPNTSRVSGGSDTNATTSAGLPSRSITPPSVQASILPGAVGSRTTAKTERGMDLPLQFRAVEVADLITSHSDDMRINPAFPQELQPRDRTRQSSADQIARIANDLRPEWLADSPKASDGAPIVGRDAIVESGNARTMALRRAYAMGKAEQYRAWLIENAERFGLDPAEVRKMKQPALVREALGDYDRAAFARQANESTVAAMSDTERAFNDAKVLPDLERLETNDDGTINQTRSADFVRQFMAELPAADRGQLLTKDGRPAQQLLNRIRNAVFARAWGDAELVARMAESTDGTTRNLLAALLRAAPRVAKLRELADAGARPPADFVPDLVEAARRYVALRQDGITVAQSLKQNDVFGDVPSERVAQFMQDIETNARAQKRIADMIERLASEIDSQGDPRQASLMEPGATYRVDQTQTPQFKAWFGDSKVVDAEGKPLVVYHGTGKNFARFDAARTGSNWKSTRYGFYFTDSPAEALHHGNRSAARNRSGGGTNIMPVYLSLKNPLLVQAGAMGSVSHFDVHQDAILRRQREGGHDGVIVDDGKERMYVALEPEQIKSAIGNRGTFDRNDANITREPEPLLRAQTPAELKARAEREAAARLADQKEQKRLADKARADAMRDEFTLTGSDRPADNPNQGSLFERPPQDPRAPYETDLFGNPVVPAAQRARPGRGGLPAPAASGRNVVPATGLPDAPPGNYATRAALVTTREQQLGHRGPVKTLADAANALAYLNRSAVERLDALVTDAQGRPLGVIGGFKGALAQTSVYPATLLGEALQIPGAANIWLVHNHPSGKSTLSRADSALAWNVANTFDGTAIKVRGMIAAGRDEWSGASGRNHHEWPEDHTAQPLAPVAGDRVPAQERQLQQTGTLGPAIESPQAAKEVVRRLVEANAYRPTIVLLDNHHQPVAAVPWSVDDAMPLRDNGKLDRLLRAVATANAGAALIGTGSAKTGARKLTTEQAQNIGAALAKADVRVLDIIDSDGKSAAELGIDTKAAVLRSVGAGAAALGLGAAGAQLGSEDRGPGGGS